MCARQGGIDDDYVEDENAKSDSEDESEDDEDESESDEVIDKNGGEDDAEPHLTVPQLIAKTNRERRKRKQAATAKEQREEKKAKQARQARQDAQESQLGESEFESDSDDDAANMTNGQLVKSMVAMQKLLMAQAKTLAAVAGNQTSANTPPSASKLSLKSTAGDDHPAKNFVVNDNTKSFGAHRVLVRANPTHRKISRDISLSLALSLA